MVHLCRSGVSSGRRCQQRRQNTVGRHTTSSGRGGGLVALHALNGGAQVLRRVLLPVALQVARHACKRGVGRVSGRHTGGQVAGHQRRQVVHLLCGRVVGHAVRVGAARRHLGRHRVRRRQVHPRHLDAQRLGQHARRVHLHLLAVVHVRLQAHGGVVLPHRLPAVPRRRHARRREQVPAHVRRVALPRHPARLVPPRVVVLARAHPLCWLAGE